MKFRNLLAAGLAACSLFTLAACKSDSEETDWDQYRQEENIIDSVATGSGETAGTLTFESIDSDSVRITGYVGPETPHSLTVPETVQTSTDTSVAPKKVTAIGARAFHSLSNLTEVVLPEGLTEIADYAFAECKQLTKVTIPSTLETMGEAVFYGCSMLTGLGAIDASKLAAIPAHCYAECTALTEVTIPGNIKTVGEGAFRDCSGLKTVTLAEGVETLDDACFINAKNIEVLNLPSTLTNTDPIKDQTFAGVEKLTVSNVKCPDNAPASVKGFIEKLLGLEEEEN